MSQETISFESEDKLVIREYTKLLREELGLSFLGMNQAVMRLVKQDIERLRSEQAKGGNDDTNG